MLGKDREQRRQALPEEREKNMTREVKEKLTRVRDWMEQKSFDGALLTTNPNFFWITGGKQGFVDKGTMNAAAHVLITRDKAYVICNSSERYRIMEEELTDGAFELIAYRWHEKEEEVLRPYLEGKRIASDTGIYGSENQGAELQTLRYVLTKEEEERLEEIGLESAQILEASVRDVKQGETEWEAVGRVAGRLMAKGYQVPVCLIASDERVLKYRHPLPTDKRIEKYVLIAVCAQKYGLTSSITRLKSFGPVPEELRKKYEALLKVDAAFILNTRAGVPVKSVLEKGYEAYRREGYEADFHLHHQGGGLGYLTRDYCADFGTEDLVLNRQGFSWNPTIAGVKLEDTYVVHGDSQKIVTETGGWIYREVTVDGKTIQRPDILVQQEIPSSASI